jgi:GT2 family glycosyltransferase
MSVRDRLAETRLEFSKARLRAAGAVDAARALSAAHHADVTALGNAWLRRRFVWTHWLAAATTRPIRHPIDTGQRGLAMLWAGVGGPRIIALIERGRFSSTPLSFHAAVFQETDRADPTQAIRWLGPVDVGGVVRQSTYAHANATLGWAIAVDRETEVAVQCALVPSVARRAPRGVFFDATLEAADGSWSAKASRRLHPRRRLRDRYWRPLVVRPPAAAFGAAVLRLTTRLPDPSVPDFGWALWGDLRMRRRRPLRTALTMLRQAVRRDGLSGAVRRLRTPPVTDARTAYHRWIAAHAPASESPAAADALAAWDDRPCISIITPVYNTDARWLRACIESVLRQTYDRWELVLADDASTSEDTIRVLDEYAGCDDRIRLVRLARNSHISAASNAALDAATGSFVGFLDHDDELAPGAMAEIAAWIRDHPDVDFIYSDEDKIDPSGARCDPYFKPDWSPEHFMNFMYTNHLMVLRRSLVDEVGRFRLGYEGSQDYDLALRVLRHTSRVGHVPSVLYHWRQIAGSAAAESEAKPWALAAARRALEDHVAQAFDGAEVFDGAAPGLFRVRRRIAGSPSVSVVITTDDRSRDISGRAVALLPNALRSLFGKTTYGRYDVIVADNRNLSEASRTATAGMPYRLVSYDFTAPFNFAHKLNFAARHATGDYLVILNDDIEIVSPDWLEGLLEYAQEPEIGAVGAKLYYPDGRLQHAGLVLGVCGVAAHVFHQAPGTTPGYFGSTLGPRNYSAVTGACMMTRRSLFEALGGFDERLAIDFNDVDYCLRLRRAGYRIVFTPHVELCHLESGSQGHRTWNAAEAEHMRRHWADVLARDPYYNANLTRAFPDYRLGD